MKIKPKVKKYGDGGKNKDTEYLKWKSKLPKNLQYEGDYDLRGFYNENPNFNPSDPNQHLTDKFKLPNHPTFSNESKYFNMVQPQILNQAGYWDETDSSYNYIPYNTMYKDTIIEKKKNGGSINKYPNGGRKPIIVNNENDPRLQAYNDSLARYNWSQKNILPNSVSTSLSDYYKDRPNSPHISMAELKEDKNIPLSMMYNKAADKYISNYKKPVQPVVYQPEDRFAGQVMQSSPSNPPANGVGFYRELSKLPRNKEQINQLPKLNQEVSQEQPQLQFNPILFDKSKAFSKPISNQNESISKEDMNKKDYFSKTGKPLGRFKNGGSVGKWEIVDDLPKAGDGVITNDLEPDTKTPTNFFKGIEQVRWERPYEGKKEIDKFLPVFANSDGNIQQSIKQKNPTIGLKQKIEFPLYKKDDEHTDTMYGDQSENLKNVVFIDQDNNKAWYTQHPEEKIKDNITEEYFKNNSNDTARYLAANQMLLENGSPYITQNNMYESKNRLIKNDKRDIKFTSNYDIDKNLMYLEPFNEEAFIGELSHAQQKKDNFKEPPELFTNLVNIHNKEKTINPNIKFSDTYDKYYYDTPGSIENDAHKYREPILEKRYNFLKDSFNTIVPNIEFKQNWELEKEEQQKWDKKLSDEALEDYYKGNIGSIKKVLNKGIDNIFGTDFYKILGSNFKKQNGGKANSGWQIIER